MKALSSRLLSLENSRGGPDAPPFWIRIMGDTEAEARADYEAVHGPIDPAAGIIFHRLVSPGDV